jgi:hypothetical protein
MAGSPFGRSRGRDPAGNDLCRRLLFLSGKTRVADAIRGDDPPLRIGERWLPGPRRIPKYDLQVYHLAPYRRSIVFAVEIGVVPPHPTLISHQYFLTAVWRAQQVFDFSG